MTSLRSWLGVYYKILIVKAVMTQLLLIIVGRVTILNIFAFLEHAVRIVVRKCKQISIVTMVIDAKALLVQLL